MTTLKLVILGDRGIGKTSMHITVTTGSYPEEYVPTIFDNYELHTTVEGTSYDVALWDFAGAEDYAPIRPLSYPDTDVFMLCFGIDSEASLSNIQSVYIPEIRKASQAPFIVIGTKLDLRDANESGLVSYEQGLEASKLYGAARYCECSSKTGKNLLETYVTAIEVAIGTEPTHTKGTESLTPSIPNLAQKNIKRANNSQL
jgi:small GTP-binding protein